VLLWVIQNQPVPNLKFAEYKRLSGLPGRYPAMIEVTDMVTRKSSKQEAPFEIAGFKSCLIAP
jgi:hypothetical protein